MEHLLCDGFMEIASDAHRAREYVEECTSQDSLLRKYLPTISVGGAFVVFAVRRAPRQDVLEREIANALQFFCSTYSDGSSEDGVARGMNPVTQATRIGEKMGLMAIEAPPAVLQLGAPINEEEEQLRLEEEAIANAEIQRKATSSTKKRPREAKKAAQIVEDLEEEEAQPAPSSKFRKVDVEEADAADAADEETGEADEQAPQDDADAPDADVDADKSAHSLERGGDDEMDVDEAGNIDAEDADADVAEDAGNSQASL